MIKPFTGWHMAGILCTFFGIVIAVNFYMARAAISTFGGTVVDNSYVASQKFNGWLATARSQDRLGWETELSLDPARHVVLAVQKGGAALTGLSSSGVASHPLGRAPQIVLDFAADSSGALRSRQALPQGRWLVHVSIRKGADITKHTRQLQ